MSIMPPLRPRSARPRLFRPAYCPVFFSLSFIILPFCTYDKIRSLSAADSATKKEERKMKKIKIKSDLSLVYPEDVKKERG